MSPGSGWRRPVALPGPMSDRARRPPRWQCARPSAVRGTVRRIPGRAFEVAATGPAPLLPFVAAVLAQPISAVVDGCAPLPRPVRHTDGSAAAFRPVCLRTTTHGRGAVRVLMARHTGTTTTCRSTVWSGPTSRIPGPELPSGCAGSVRCGACRSRVAAAPSSPPGGPADGRENGARRLAIPHESAIHPSGSAASANRPMAEARGGACLSPFSPEAVMTAGVHRAARCGSRR